jgi:hypothetical protein
MLKQIIPPLVFLFSIAIALPSIDASAGKPVEPQLQQQVLSVPFGAATASATTPQPAQNNTPAATQEPPACSEGSSQARVSFEWQPVANANEQWLDVSTDKTFPRDSTRAAGPFPPGMTSFTWDLEDGAPIYWRVTGKVDGSFSPSPTRVVAPCAATQAVSTTICGDNESVEFSWQKSPLPIIGQWLDISSFDTGFMPGTFESVRIEPGAVSVNWSELPGHALLWRVNTLTPKGWRTSEVQPIATCDRPLALHPTYSCAGDRVVAEFHWAPPAETEHWQVVDLSLRLNGFEQGTYASSGQLPRDADSHLWPGLYANVEHFYRVNALTPDGWRTSVTRSFIPTCTGS